MKNFIIALYWTNVKIITLLGLSSLKREDMRHDHGVIII